jgi:hypothetical protein
VVGAGWQQRKRALAMNALILRRMLCAAAISFSASAPDARNPAQRGPSNSPSRCRRSTGPLTMAPDGSFGAATHAFANRNIAGAIDGCRAMSPP